MYDLSQAFSRAVSDGRAPILALRLTTSFGVRYWADRALPLAHSGLTGPLAANGSTLADGSQRAGEGSFSLLEMAPRVLSMGRLRETLTPQSGDFLASLGQEEPASITVTLTNDGPDEQRPMSRIEARENLLGAVGELIVGLPDVPAREHMVRFHGQVVSYTLSATALRLCLKAA